jgi:sugar phosphate permease
MNFLLYGKSGNVREVIDPAGRPSLRWVVLAVGLLAQAATSLFLYGLPTVLPALRSAENLSLFAASAVVVAPIAGLLVTLIGWGAAADRWGERVVMASGTGIAAAFLGVAAMVHGMGALMLALFVAGAGGGSVNAASGRLVMGWFGRHERGLAMGIRQTAQPLGVALAALALPPLARDHGFTAAMVFAAGACGFACVLVAFFTVDPARPVADATATRSPYRETAQWWTNPLWRIHAASSLLVVPQFAMSAFTLVYLVDARDWDPVTAGRVVFAFQFAGAAGRIAAGVWSDRVGSRLRPIRQLALGCVVLMGLLAVGAGMHQVWIVGVFAGAAVVTVADNGLAFTAVAERAGPFWAGRALGTHNTVQNVVAVATPPMLAAIVGESRFALGFAVVAIFPLLAMRLVPVRAEQEPVA